MKITYRISELVPYINWVYYFFAWQVKDEAEKQRMQREALSKLEELDAKYHVYGVFELFDACSDNEDILIYRSMMCQKCGVKHSVRVGCIPCLRQQQGKPPYLCLADYIRPLNISHSTFHLPPSTNYTSKLGLFATSVDIGLETDFDNDVYQKMVVQLLADRLAEAAAERLHEQVRKEFWGYAKDENLSIADMLIERFQGIRPAVGYPSLPDTSLNFVLDDILDLKQIGIRLTESGAMKPHASVSGMMISNPKAKYFSIGKIGEDQLQDYAHRRGLPVEVIRKFVNL